MHGKGDDRFPGAWMAEIFFVLSFCRTHSNLAVKSHALVSGMRGDCLWCRSLRHTVVTVLWLSFDPPTILDYGLNLVDSESGSRTSKSQKGD